MLVECLFQDFESTFRTVEFSLAIVEYNHENHLLMLEQMIPFDPFHRCSSSSLQREEWISSFFRTPYITTKSDLVVSYVRVLVRYTLVTYVLTNSHVLYINFLQHILNCCPSCLWIALLGEEVSDNNLVFQ